MRSLSLKKRVRNKVLGESFIDAGCFLCGYRRECIEKLRLYKGLHVFVGSLLGIEGLRIKETPVKISPRKYGKSNYGISNRLFNKVIALLVVKWMQNNRLKYKISYSD